ncbi:acetate--CoA ligase family protein [Paracandidimonas lactea]|uniref:acetate--CoA ligase family protein n=1 Tax=Paracandidimonas lactea TaxID=2895524 RepID=UPI001EEFAFF6|nr:acetate--CoA ligase family protein [Paracandidimonas lactea]
MVLCNQIERILNPRSVAVIGASGDSTKWGDSVLALIRDDAMLKGHIALISQSEALTGAMLAHAYDIGAGFSFCVSLGDQADLETCDFLEYAIADANTKVMALYIEGLKNPARFKALLEAARRAGKPVLITKAGRTSSGARAVHSHTASMAGAYQSFRAMVEGQAATIIDDPLQLVAEAAVWDAHRPMRGARVAVFSSSGDGGVLAVDALEDAGLMAATLSDTGALALGRLASLATARLPLDIGAVQSSLQKTVHSDSWLQDVLATVMDDAQVDAGLYLMTTQPDMEGVANAFVQAQHASAKPLVFINAASSCGIEAVARIKASGLAHFASLPQAAQHLRHRYRYASHCADLANPGSLPRLDAQALEKTVAKLPAGIVSEPQTKALLHAAGVPVALGRVATSAPDAVAAAESLGYPVVMKVVSPQITHKSDIGGVLVGVRTAQAVQEGFERIRGAAARVPGARFDGCLVQRMATSEAELLVGTHWDAQLGAFLTFGFGGTLVELHRDTCLLPADAGPAQVRRALPSLRLHPTLTGYRGRQPADLEGLVDVICRMGRLAVYFGERLQECEVNPLMINGATIVAADARAVWKPCR